MGYYCERCGQWVDGWTHVCAGSGGVLPYPFPAPEYTPFTTWNITSPALFCPKCHGGFTWWDDNKCPFCGTEKGKYAEPPKMQPCKICKHEIIPPGREYLICFDCFLTAMAFGEIIPPKLLETWHKSEEKVKDSDNKN